MIWYSKLRRHIARSAAWRSRLGLVQGLSAYLSFNLAQNRDPVGKHRVVPLNWRGGPVQVRAGTSDLDVLVQVVLHGAMDFPVEGIPRRIIDGGANIGLASRAFHERWPESQLLAVELASSNLPLLRENLASVSGCEILHGAVWGSLGAVSIANPGAEAWAFQAVAGHSSSPAIPAFGVAELMDKVGWDYVDLLKLDIEGAEVEVLDSAGEWIDRVGCVAVELHDRFRPGCTEAFRRALDDEWSVSQHGEYLVATRRKPGSTQEHPSLGRGLNGGQPGMISE